MALELVRETGSVYAVFKKTETVVRKKMFADKNFASTSPRRRSQTLTSSPNRKRTMTRD